MLTTLIKKYDSSTIISFLCLGLIFGLNGCVQSSILLNFYDPKLSCHKPSVSPFYQYIQVQNQSNHSHQNATPQDYAGVRQSGSEDKECNPCKEGYRGKIYLIKEYSQIYSMVEQFEWFCLEEYQKIAAMSMMASGLFIGFLTNFLVGDTQRVSNNGSQAIYQKGMRQILLSLYVQTFALLCVRYVHVWYQAGLILAVWNFGYSFFYSSIYSLIAQKYGTLIIKYSSTIYHAIWSLVMIAFLIFVRFFGDWRDVMFYFSALPQTFFVLCLTVALCFQKNLSKAKPLQSIRSHIQQDPNQQQLATKYLHTEEQLKQEYYFDSELTEYNEDPDGTKNQQQTFVLSRFQTEDFLLSVQVNQTGNDVDSHHGTAGGGMYYGGPQESHQNSYYQLDSFQLNDNSKVPFDQDSRKSVNNNNNTSGRMHPSSSKNQIFENLKQKMFNMDLTPEQLKQQQEQFIMHSDLNINFEQNVPNQFVTTLDNESKHSKPNIHYQSQLVQNTFERLDSSETQKTNTLKQSQRDLQSFKLISNTPKQTYENDQSISPNLSPMIQITNPNLQGSFQNKFDFKEDAQDGNKQHQGSSSFPNSSHNMQQISSQTLQQLLPTTKQVTNFQTMRQEMKTRWMQLKRDRSQKQNILIFLCCWITANITNYGIYITLLFIQGDIYMKLTLCIIIEIISNYLASFILIHFHLRKVILSLFFISGVMCLATFFMDKTSEAVLFPLFVTKLCMELFFPIKTFFLQFVLHSQYFKISLGLGDTLSTLLQALMPLFIYISYSDKGYFLSFVGILMIFCFLMILQIEMINIYGLNHQFSVIYKEENRQSNIRGLAEIMEVDSAADISLYSFQPPNH